MDKKKTRPVYLLPIRDPLQIKRHTQTEWKGMENNFHANGNKNTGKAILMSNKIDQSLYQETKKDIS